MRVLIAEDDRNLRSGLADLLRAEGFTCDTTEDGNQALEAFLKTRHPIVLLDVVMPGQDGLSLCRRMRAESPRTQIMLLSARGEEHDRVLGLEFGADDYLAKPFSPRELVARVKAMARRNGGDDGPTAPFTMDDLAIDPGALRASRDGRDIALTPRELNVLTVLHQQAGRALSRDELLDRCWGRAHYPNSRALDQYISTLRHKIEKDPSRPRIIGTVRGVGYRFDPAKS